MARAGERLRSWLERLGQRLAGSAGARPGAGPGPVGTAVPARAVQAIPPEADEIAWETPLAAGSLPDRPWHEVRALLEEAARACETNPLAARLIHMTTDFVIGAGATLRVRPAAARRWVQAFWNHPLNRLSERIYAWCDELSRSGELFLVLSRNPVDGMSYVREVPALQIDAIACDPDDLERELRYHQLTADVEGRWWPAARTASQPDAGPEGDPDQVMLHYAINRPVGSLRGRSDLAQILPWLHRYDLWLEDRVRINRYKGAYLWHVRIDGAQAGTLEAKRRQYSRVPRSGSIIISDESEHWEAVSPQIHADDVAADGRAIRMMIAAGAGVPLHYLAEGESATRSTAREMGTPTLRRFAHRQFLFEAILTDLIRTAARRSGAQATRGDLTIALRFDPVLPTGEAPALAGSAPGSESTGPAAAEPGDLASGPRNLMEVPHG